MYIDDFLPLPASHPHRGPRPIMKDAAPFPRAQERKVLFVGIVGKNETLNSAFFVFFLGRPPVGHRSFVCME